MSGILQWLFGGPEREGRQLARDARAIIEAARASYRAESMGRIASLVRRHVTESSEHCGDDVACIERAITHFREQNRGARQGHDQIGLTAYSLIVIHLRAGLIAGHGAPAREAIAGFLSEWQHLEPEGRTDPG